MRCAGEAETTAQAAMYTRSTGSMVLASHRMMLGGGTNGQADSLRVRGSCYMADIRKEASYIPGMQGGGRSAAETHQMSSYMTDMGAGGGYMGGHGGYMAGMRGGSGGAGRTQLAA